MVFIQYSVTEHFKISKPGETDSVGVFFHYDFSPIKVCFLWLTSNMLVELNSLFGVLHDRYTIMVKMILSFFVWPPGVTYHLVLYCR